MHIFTCKIIDRNMQEREWQWGEGGEWGEWDGWGELRMLLWEGWLPGGPWNPAAACTCWRGRSRRAGRRLRDRRSHRDRGLLQTVTHHSTIAAITLLSVWLFTTYHILHLTTINSSWKTHYFKQISNNKIIYVWRCWKPCFYSFILFQSYAKNYQCMSLSDNWFGT